MVMNMLHGKLIFPLRWNKVDSHIEMMVYKEGKKTTRDEFSIRLNTIVDMWAGAAREEGKKGIKRY